MFGRELPRTDSPGSLSLLESLCVLNSSLTSNISPVGGMCKTFQCSAATYRKSSHSLVPPMQTFTAIVANNPHALRINRWDMSFTRGSSSREPLPFITDSQQDVYSIITILTCLRLKLTYAEKWPTGVVLYLEWPPSVVVSTLL